MPIGSYASTTSGVADFRSCSKVDPRDQHGRAQLEHLAPSGALVVAASCVWRTAGAANSATPFGRGCRKELAEKARAGQSFLQPRMIEGKAKTKRRILLADNNESVQRIVREMAQGRGHVLVKATTGASALLVAIETQPDVIVLDLALPDADGRDVLRQLKMNRETAHIPVVVWSGRQGHESDSRISLDLGAEDYVEKDEDDAQLLLLKLERVLLRLDR